MSHLPFSATGSTDKLVPNAGSDSGDLGAVLGNTVLVVNSSAVVVHIKLSDTASPTAAATDLPVDANHSVTISRAENQRYIAAYSAGDASAGVYVVAGNGV